MFDIIHRLHGYLWELELQYDIDEITEEDLKRYSTMFFKAANNMINKL